MTDDQKKAWRIEFARLNAGRRVRIARNTGMWAEHIEGVLSPSAKESYWEDGRSWDAPVLVKGPVYSQNCLPEDLDPIDGLGPLKFPNAVTPPGYIENIKVDAVIAPPYAKLAEKVREVLGAGAGRVTPPPKVDPLAAVTRTLNLLHSLSPLPCWTVDQERELVACGRELLAVVRALQSAVKK